MSTICGHDRDIVRLGISILALSDNATEYADQIERDHNSTGHIKAVTRALVNPAKLAEIMAERGQELGLATYPSNERERPPFPCYGFTALKDGVFVARWTRYTAHDFERIATMPQARAILLEWLTCDNQESAIAALRKER